MAIKAQRIGDDLYCSGRGANLNWFYLVDTQADLANLPDLTNSGADISGNTLPPCSAGSQAKVISDGTIWILSTAGVWIKQPDQAADLASLKEYILPVQLQFNQGTGTTLAVMLHSLAGVDLSGQQNYLINGDPLEQYAVIFITCVGGTFTVTGATSTGTAGYYRVNGGEPVIIISS